MALPQSLLVPSGGRFKGGRLGEGWAGWDIRKVNAQDWF